MKFDMKMNRLDIQADIVWDNHGENKTQNKTEYVKFLFTSSCMEQTWI